MTMPATQIAELEWANYAATRSVAQVTPGLEVELDDQVVITCSQILPIPDANHACLLRATTETIDGLIDRIIDRFAAQDMPATIYVSPACTPADLPKRLQQRGFRADPHPEAWMVLDLTTFRLPPDPAGVRVRPLDKTQVETMAQIFMAAFDMPAEMAPMMAQLLEPSIGLPDIEHYMAFIHDQPVGICSVNRYRQFGVLGSTGVLPSQRGTRAASALAIRACRDAQRHGIETLLLQTRADTLLERLLRINGFRRAFTRVCYTQ